MGSGARIHAFARLLQRHRAGAVETRQAVVAADECHGLAQRRAHHVAADGDAHSLEHHALLEVHLLGQRLKRGVDVGGRPLGNTLKRGLGGIQNGTHAFLGQTLVDRLLVILERLGRSKDGGGDGHDVGRHFGARLDDGSKRVDPVLAVLDVTLDETRLVQLGDHDLVGKLGSAN